MSSFFLHRLLEHNSRRPYSRWPLQLLCHDFYVDQLISGISKFVKNLISKSLHLYDSTSFNFSHFTIAIVLEFILFEVMSTSFRTVNIPQIFAKISQICFLDFLPASSTQTCCTVCVRRRLCFPQGGRYL